MKEKDAKRAEAYATNKGNDVLERHLLDASGRCGTCWARVNEGEEHHTLCPNRPLELAPPTQDEALF